MWARESWPWVATGLLCLVVGSLVYINTLNCGIVYDDEPAIKKNRDLHPEASWTSLLVHDFWGTVITNPTSHKSYRPLCVATFKLNYLLHELQPMGYHLVNILLHGAVCYLYVQLCGLVFSQVWPALIAGLLFAVHPIHTEAVAGLVGRTELLAAIFFIAAFLVYKRAVHTKKGMKWVWLSFVLTVCSVLSKEQGVTVVAVCVVYDFFVAHQMILLSIPTFLRTLTSHHPKWFGEFFKRTFILGFSTGFLLALRIALVGGAPKIIVENINPPLFLPFPYRQLNWLHLTFVNLWITILPSRLCADWRFGAVPLVSSLADPNNLLTLMTLVAVGGLLMFALTGREEKHKVTLFGLSLIIFPFLPASNLFFPVGFVVAERVLYLPSMGVCLLVGYGAWRLHFQSNSLVMRSLVKVTLLTLILTMASRTYIRNRDWKDNESLYASGVRVNPHNGVLITNLGIEHGRMRNFSYAERLYRWSIEVAPLHSRGFSNLGGLLEALKRYDEAEMVFRKAIKLGPLDSTGSKVVETLEFLINEIILRDNERYGDALQLVEEMLVTYPTYAKLYNLKGIILQHLNQTESAIEYLDIAVNSNIKSPETFYHLGLAHLQLNHRQTAIKNFKKTAMLDANFRDIAKRLSQLTENSTV